MNTLLVYLIDFGLVFVVLNQQLANSLKVP
jgi:hypothetical protein